ncbi:MAG: DNA/RNA nuclease SfsA [Alphaproteobacteria bacterium]|nr:DNA/RNA nuclease SfsA [Alphaproteobacteria bacterium]MDD9919843.1 DNA/RNA nuclease SfsA [Alphaproteobacteria bacterium]
MKFDKPILKATFLKRYKRFFVDAQLPDGITVTAHCPNTGSMKGLLVEGADMYLTHHNDPKRKLQYTTEVIFTPTSPVGINTSRPNKLVAEAITNGTIAELQGYETIKPEVKYGTNSRIDLLLTAPNKPDCYVEVKNTTMAEGHTAMFPDAVTERGRKHLNELAEMVKQGHRAVMVFLTQRMDCTTFTPADNIDPAYGETLRHVLNAGVEAICYDCTINEKEITTRNKLEIKL